MTHFLFAELLILNRRARRAAPREVRELCEPDAPFGQSVEVRRRDLRAVASEIGESHVIGQDQNNFRPPRLRPQGPANRSRNGRGQCAPQQLPSLYTARSFFAPDSQFASQILAAICCGLPLSTKCSPVLVW